MRCFKSVIIFGSLAVAGVAVAQGSFMRSDIRGMLIGRVYDAETLEPLSDTNVYLEGLGVGTATARDGRFVIESVRPGTYTLIVQRIGYEKYVEDNLKIEGDKSVLRQIPLWQTVVKAEEVTVTATFREQTAQMAPASVNLVGQRELRQRAIVTFDQALETVPGVSIYRAAGISVQSMSIRGSSDVAGGGVGNRVLLLIDGRPALSSDSGGALWSLVPMNAVDHIEVLKGAFSSLYGSTAMGGVVNVITRNPTYRATNHLDVGFGFFEPPHPELRYSDNPLTYNQIAFSRSGVSGQFSYLFNVSRKQSTGHAENTGYRFYDVFSKFVYDLRKTRYLELSLSSSAAKNDYPHTWMSNLQPYRVLPKHRDDLQKKRVYSADLRYWALPSKKVRYSTRFYYYRNAARSFFNPNDSLLTIPGNHPFGMQTKVDADKYGSLTQVDLYFSERNNLIAGLDLQMDRVWSSPDTVMYGNRQVNNFAVYAQDEWQITPRLTATIGLRYDVNHLIGGKTWSQMSSNFAAIYHPIPNLALRLLYGQAFRAPSIAERFFQKELNGGTLFKPNPDLKPERMDFSLEAGLRWHWRDLIDFNVSYFRYHYKDMIYWIEISAEEGVIYTLFQVRNLNRALTQGVEVALNVHPVSAMKATVSYTFLDARDQSPNRLDDYLAYRVRHSLNVALSGQWQRYTLRLDGRYKSKVEEVFLYPREAPEAFFVTNAKISMEVTPALQLSLGVQNIFDTEYEELARYRMPGRNWLLSSSWQF